MSIELPEVIILSRQMREHLIGKKIESYSLDNYEKLQRSGFFNKNISDYDEIIGKKIVDVLSIGIVIRIKLDKNSNLLLSPEMGGEIRYLTKTEKIPKQYHLLLRFSDESVLSIRLKGYGLIYFAKDNDLQNVYVYCRDSEGLSPLSENFTEEVFHEELEKKDQYLKLALVGKSAAVMGFGNAGFQEIAHQAKIHPKRRTSSLSRSEIKYLFKTINEVVKKRIEKGGKFEFSDLFGKNGEYIPSVGSHTRDKPCIVCGTTIERMQFAGGPTYFCPICQVIE